MQRVLVRGCGDVGSAVACVLYKAGYAVAIHDSAQPTATRRKMAFADAIFDGSAEVEGIRGILLNDPAQLRDHLKSKTSIPVTTLTFDSILPILQPDILVDARMRKHDQPEKQIGLAPFTVGLGPNFTAGETVHAAVETGWGDDLGRVVWTGNTRPLQGEPQTIAGHARDRYVYAPAAGVFHTDLYIGATVNQGQEIAWIGDAVLRAPIDGVIRGLTHDAVPVKERTKIIEVDPRGSEAQITGIAKRPGKIAAGVLQAVQEKYRG